MNVPLWIAIPVVVTTALAVGADVRTRRIPNLLTGPALLLGLVVNTVWRGGHGALDGLEGMAIAGAMLLPGWFMGWMGAGDVKLVAAVGAWLGFPLGVIAALASLMAGGVIALVVATRHGVLKRSLFGAAMLGSWVATGSLKSAPPPVTSGVRFPFAAAVLAGSVAALWVHA
jgi:prepilin peptidase CpaA